MGFDAVRAKTAEVLEQALAVKHPGTLVVAENHKFTRAATQPWVYITMQPGVIKRMNLGLTRRQFRRYGVVVVNIMVPIDTGSKILYDISDTVFAAIGDRNFNLGANGYLKLSDASQRNRGVINGFLTWNIQVEYCHDTIIEKPADG